jgi:hypothetical protein
MLQVGCFHEGAHARDADGHHIIFNPDNRWLTSDVNGSAPGGRRISPRSLAG